MKKIDLVLQLKDITRKEMAALDLLINRIGREGIKYIVEEEYAIEEDEIEPMHEAYIKLCRRIENKDLRQVEIKDITQLQICALEMLVSRIYHSNLISDISEEDEINLMRLALTKLYVALARDRFDSARK